MKKLIFCQGILLIIIWLYFTQPFVVRAQYGTIYNCGVGSNCSDPCILECSDSTCGAGVTCVCTCPNGQPPPGTGGSCTTTADCGGGAPCPINQSGEWACVGGVCQSFCGTSGGPEGPGPVPPGSTPTPTPNPPCNTWVCGACSGSPATRSCVNNCGDWIHLNCGGSINARAVVVPYNTSQCADVIASTTGINGTTLGFSAGSASQPAPQTQSGASYVTFSNIMGGNYTLAPTLPAGYSSYVLALACWRAQLNTPTSGTGFTASLSVPTNYDTLTWDVGYGPPGPWAQTQGGSIYAAGTIRSLVPSSISPRVFALTGQ